MKRRLLHEEAKERIGRGEQDYIITDIVHLMRAVKVAEKKLKDAEYELEIYLDQEIPE